MAKEFNVRNEADRTKALISFERSRSNAMMASEALRSIPVDDFFSSVFFSFSLVSIMDCRRTKILARFCATAA